MSEPAVSQTRLTLAELDEALRAVDPAVLLLPPRILRRVIREDRRLRGLRLHVPHGLGYIVGRELFVNIVDRSELWIEVSRDLPDRLLLLPQPDGDTLENTPAEQILTEYWRSLFHLRIHQELETRLPRGAGGAAAFEERIERLGAAEFDEIRSVLDQEGLLFPDADPRSVLVEFAAFYMELRYFAPGSLPRYFPAFERRAVAMSVVAELVHGAALFADTRPEDAELPAEEVPLADYDALPPAAESPEPPPRARPRRPSMRKYQALVAAAERAATRGNLARACILLLRARQRAPDRAENRARAAVKDTLGRFVRRLQNALGFADNEIDAWQEALSALLTYSADGIWTSEARLLFDLQKICVDRERSVFAVDLKGYLRSRGRQPLERPLPRLEEVLICRHLRTALGRVATVRIADSQRQHLHTLLRSAAESSEEQLRDRFRPIIDRALREASLLPDNLVERVAARKLVEELADQIIDRGYLTIGALRDALARNNLKIRDLAGARDLILGDELLRADEQMAASLEGVHRKGEAYMRAIQRLSSVGFGTPVGRFLTRYLVLPFGGAYVIEAGLQHLISVTTGAGDIGLEYLPAVILLGLFLMLLINVDWFRLGVWELLQTAGRGLRFALRDLPQRVLRLPVVQRVLHSTPFRWATRFLVKPLVATGLITWLMPELAATWRNSWTNTLAVFLVLALVLNSRVGRDMEELAAEWLARLWRWFGIQVLARLFWLIMDLFRAGLDAVERLMYSVDEWLRFRTGETRLTLAGKLVLGSIWGAIAYVARFCINLLIEPQVNPIKHFPVVTVSHKVLIPFAPLLAGVLELAMEKGLAITVAGAIITSIPGIFGFLAWELRENWRLYVANRPRGLTPVVVGRHGETVRRLLLPGFHSGTIPKRYARLRKAESEARRKGSWSAVRRHLRAIKQIEAELGRFVERELIWLLTESRCWKAGSIELGRIHLATNRIRLELHFPASDDALSIVFEARQQGLVGNLAGTEALRQFDTEARRSLTTGLVGLFKMAGVDRLGPEAEAVLPLALAASDPARPEHNLWPEAYAVEVCYDLERSAPVRTDLSVAGRALPAFGAAHVVWRQWERIWTNWELPATRHEPRPLAVEQPRA